MKILFIGPPGSGKGTVGSLLSERLKIPIISVGKLLRSVDPRSPYYTDIKESMDRGDLAPNNIVGMILEKRVLEKDCLRGYILDGWARQLSDLGYFNPGFDLVLLLKISEEVSIRRITGRRECKTDGSIYNIYTNPPKKSGICDLCGAPLVQRNDDKQEIVLKRLEDYKEKTLPSLEFYRKMGILTEVDGDRKPEEVFAEMVSALGIGND